MLDDRNVHKNVPPPPHHMRTANISLLIKIPSKTQNDFSYKMTFE